MEFLAWNEHNSTEIRNVLSLLGLTNAIESKLN